MWRVDASVGFTFSDATDPKQMVLFDSNEANNLIDILQNQFSGLRMVDIMQRGSSEDSVIQ